MSQPGMKMSLRGWKNADRQLQRILEKTAQMGDWKAEVYSRLPYAWGQEYGRHRVSGRLARKSGGAMYLNRARSEMLAGADRDISEGLSRVSMPGIWVLKRMSLWTRRLARVYAPRKRRGVKKSHHYRLWRSLSARWYRRV
ncbi:MAG: hypothetical protein D6706_07375 [Chloroflexi bacterium]|nr:MAG: hypothetical protein D6706_07375 [Chloroflexota bacterium]